MEEEIWDKVSSWGSGEVGRELILIQQSHGMARKDEALRYRNI